MLLAVDPGLNSPGMALFANGRLIGADHFHIKMLENAGEGARWLDVAQRIATWPRGTMYNDGIIDEIVFEKPEMYPHSKVNPNQLIGLAGIGSCVAGILAERFPRLKVRSPLPKEWVGQLSKICPSCGGKVKKKCLDCHGSAWETPRGRRIRSRLTEAERAFAPDQNDAIDAVGLGLWACGRLAPEHRFSNGR